MQNRVKIYDIHVEYDVVHRNVKYARLELKTTNLRVILPTGFNDHEKFIEKHKNWIYKKITAIKSSLEESENKQLNFKRTDDKFRELVHFLAEKYSCELNADINQIYFRKMKSRGGSCSSKRNININIFMKYLPENLIEYVIFHEIAHLVELNHSKRFWNIISEKFDNYKEIENDLLVYWLAIKEIIIKSS